MAVFDTLTYVLDLRDRPNCSRIERAKPGEEIEVLVHPIHDPQAPSILAKGTLSEDGASFYVVITRTEGWRMTERVMLLEKEGPMDRPAEKYQAAED